MMQAVNTKVSMLQLSEGSDKISDCGNILSDLQLAANDLIREMNHQIRVAGNMTAQSIETFIPSAHEISKLASIPTYSKTAMSGHGHIHKKWVEVLKKWNQASTEYHARNIDEQNDHFQRQNVAKLLNISTPQLNSLDHCYQTAQLIVVAMHGLSRSIDSYAQSHY